MSEAQTSYSGLLAYVINGINELLRKLPSDDSRAYAINFISTDPHGRSKFESRHAVSESQHSPAAHDAVNPAHLANAVNSISKILRELPEHDQEYVIDCVKPIKFKRTGASTDPVNHPAHYNASPSGVECIDVVEHLSFNVGNAMKYLWRAGLKGDHVQDMKKAVWYVEREIKRLNKEKP